MDKQRILLYSGGIDSYIAYHYLGYPQTIYFALDHKYELQEIAAIKRTIPQTLIVENVLTLGAFEEPDANIRSRNLMLLLAAAYYVQASTAAIYLVVQKGEMNIPDRTSDFLMRSSKMISELTEKEIVVGSPFTQMTKTEMVEWYLTQKLPVDGLLNTHACYQPKEVFEGTEVFRKPCHACPACFRRWVALYNNNIEEANAHQILEWIGIDSYIERIADGKYDLHRSGETLRAIKKGVNNLPLSTARKQKLDSLFARYVDAKGIFYQ